MYNLNTNNLIVYTVLDLKLFDKEFRSTQLVFSYQGGKKVSELLPGHPYGFLLTVYCYIYYTNPLNMWCQWRGRVLQCMWNKALSDCWSNIDNKIVGTSVYSNRVTKENKRIRNYFVFCLFYFVPCFDKGKNKKFCGTRHIAWCQGMLSVTWNCHVALKIMK